MRNLEQWRYNKKRIEKKGGDFMAYVALYRKWRPGTFSELVGQEHISRTLSNAIRSGRIGHAYLFSGPRGTGKTSTAKIFAKALNCEQGPTPDPCNTCENCQKINEGTSMDVFEIDAASNRGIDEIRDLRETVKFAPVDGRYKVYIIDEVHMLTTEAFNALLKTLEEPPAHVVFILATTEAHKVPATIQSRCQRYDFKRITVEEIVERLRLVARETEISAEDEALHMIAVQADGGMRDALSILDQCAALSDAGVTAERVQQLLGLVGREWVQKLTASLAKKDASGVLAMVDELLRDGKDLKQLLAEMAMHLRGLMIYQAAGRSDEAELYQEPDQVLREQADFFTQEQIMAMIQRLHEAMNEVKWSPQPRITVEAVLLSLCREPAVVRTAGAAAASPAAGNGSDSRIHQLEAQLAQLAARLNGLAAGRPAMPAAPARPAPGPRPATTAPVAAAVAAPAEIDGVSRDIWQRLLELLKSQDKAPVLACIEKSEFRGIRGNQLFLVFRSPMLKQLTERNYRRLLEPMLRDIAGTALQVVCQLEAPSVPAPSPAPGPKEPEIPPPPESEMPPELSSENLSPEESKNLGIARKFLGDHIVKVEDLPKE